ENPELLLEAAANAAATRLLLDLGADPDAPNENGRAPLHWAAWENSGEVVRLLLARGASCEIRERDHDATPVGFANHAGHFELRDLLLDHSRDVFDLAAWGRVEQLREVLKSDPALANARLAGGHTPVHGVTAGPEGEQVLDLLLAHGADIDASAADGATPLSAALQRGDEELAALLEARGARETGGG
ncbi:MAG: ankyrin repeat domain-containing protein, partial [Gemmatimonadetes bacterium]|nr:ankyrin repeat domain-containing protein [Gemmatimonadota bacterium]